MARLKVKDPSSSKRIGKAVLDAAVAKTDPNSHQPDIKAKLIKALQAETSSTKNITFMPHFDTATTINVIVPHLTKQQAKSIKDQQGISTAGSKFDLVKFSYEAMGHIVILGCGE